MMSGHGIFFPLLLSRKYLVQHFSSSYLLLKIIISDIVRMEGEKGNNLLDSRGTKKLNKDSEIERKREGDRGGGRERERAKENS